MKQPPLKDIFVWYSFIPDVSMWFSKKKGKTHSHFLPNETWYGGAWFNTGYFMFIQFGFFALHIKLTWWKIRLS